MKTVSDENKSTDEYRSLDEATRNARDFATKTKTEVSSKGLGSVAINAQLNGYTQKIDFQISKLNSAITSTKSYIEKIEYDKKISEFKAKVDNAHTIYDNSRWKVKETYRSDLLQILEIVDAFIDQKINNNENVDANSNLTQIEQFIPQIETKQKVIEDLISSGKYQNY